MRIGIPKESLLEEQKRINKQKQDELDRQIELVVQQAQNNDHHDIKLAHVRFLHGQLLSKYLSNSAIGPQLLQKVRLNHARFHFTE